MNNNLNSDNTASPLSININDHNKFCHLRWTWNFKQQSIFRSDSLHADSSPSDVPRSSPVPGIVIVSEGGLLERMVEGPTGFTGRCWDKCPTDEQTAVLIDDLADSCVYFLVAQNVRVPATVMGHTPGGCQEGHKTLAASCALHREFVKGLSQQSRSEQRTATQSRFTLSSSQPFLTGYSRALWYQCQAPWWPRQVTQGSLGVWDDFSRSTESSLEGERIRIWSFWKRCTWLAQNV